MENVYIYIYMIKTIFSLTCLLLKDFTIEMWSYSRKDYLR